MRSRVYCIIILTFLVVALSTAFAYLTVPFWRAEQNVRQIAIELENFAPSQTQAVRSAKEFQEVLDGLEKDTVPPSFKRDWLARCRQFDKTIRAANVEFEKETLILIRYQAPRGTEVGLSRLHLHSRV